MPPFALTQWETPPAPCTAPDSPPSPPFLLFPPTRDLLVELLKTHAQVHVAHMSVAPFPRPACI
eukprot:9309008-Pyramimonas_sp.AAC.1